MAPRGALLPTGATYGSGAAPGVPKDDRLPPIAALRRVLPEHSRSGRSGGTLPPWLVAIKRTRKTVNSERAAYASIAGSEAHHVVGPRTIATYSVQYVQVMCTGRFTDERR